MGMVAAQAGEGAVEPMAGAASGNGAGGEAAAAGAPSIATGMVYGVDGQSCSDGLTCPGGESCCRRLEVPAGKFSMGASDDGNALADEKPAHDATLSAFTLDELEVTVGRFRRFVEAFDGTLPTPGLAAHPQIAGSGWQTAFTAEMPATRAALEEALSCDVGAYQTWTTAVGARESFPINCVNWYVAFAFCAWDGGRLPSEAEWERAASGGADERLSPWGAAAPDYALHAVANCRGDGSAGCAPSDLLAVGSRPGGAGYFGHLDLAGSLWEWTLDHYDATFYQSLSTCTDCADLSGSTPRVIRGGNFTSLPKNLRATGRASKPPGVTDPYAGFRCARSP
jgi:formylglycine-generating enzyme required for sulfatase activity